MLQNAYFLAKIGADTAENEQHFAEILPIGRRVTGRFGVGPARALRRPRPRRAHARHARRAAADEPGHTPDRVFCGGPWCAETFPRVFSSVSTPVLPIKALFCVRRDL